MEILPGIHRIQSDLGARFMCHYVLVGEDRPVLVDTGLAGTPEEIIIPYLQEIGLSLEDIDEVTDLRELTRRADERLGPYPEFAHELAAGVRAHMAIL